MSPERDGQETRLSSEVKMETQLMRIMEEKKAFLSYRNQLFPSTISRKRAVYVQQRISKETLSVPSRVFVCGI